LIQKAAADASGAPLVVRCGAFGDMVLLTALIRPLYARFERPVDIVTSGAWSAPLLEGQPGVGEVLCMRSRKTPFWLAPDQQRIVRRLRGRPIGPTWYCDGSDAARPLIERAGIPADWIVDVKDHALLPGEHATEQWRRLAAIMPEAIEARPSAAADAVAPGCQLSVSLEQEADLDAWLEARGLGGSPLLLIQAGNKRTMRRGFRRLAVNHKYWPKERWAAVILYLRARCPQHRIVLLGTGPEYRLNEELIAAACVHNVVNAADDLPIPRLVALLARAAALVTVDSGPAHAAAAVGCPQVVLFGRASPALYKPRGTSGADVKLLTGVQGGEPSMLGITASQVFEAFAALELRSRHSEALEIATR
jgi:heptosyltransferase-2/heptosyltransferase-3